MLSFLDFVRHDLAFYSISRQMKDRRLYVTEQRKAAAAGAAGLGGGALNGRSPSPPGLL